MPTETDSTDDDSKYNMISNLVPSKSLSEVAFVEERVGLIVSAGKVRVNHGRYSFLGHRVVVRCRSLRLLVNEDWHGRHCYDDARKVGKSAHGRREY